ncbi:hypothetical protein NQ317_016754 [Molorchus minor]|uniref:Uncharacterized protein n=1 Tax=Molorchus minor TaxID=1323400 RepID=A0ABQ9JML0_9CUCU|nr:hypothetical protein NQ317_016754 [Molorchus minor]
MARRDIYSRFERGLQEGGFNGTACLKRMICDARNYIPLRGKSLVKDLLLALFTSPEAELEVNYQESCDDKTWVDCSVPFLDYVLNSLYGTNNYNM